ncbi:regulatory protein RecX [Flexivirga sp. B27]
MNPFDSAPDSPPDFVDPAEVIVGPWAGSSSQAGPDADGATERERPAAARGRSRRGSHPAGSALGRRTARQARNDREPPPDKGGPDADPHDVARTIVLKQLTAAPRSRKQLADKLRERGCEDEVAAEVLDRLEETGLIDDAAYAATLVRSQQERRGLARRAIAQELRRKGVDSDVINEQLDTIDDDDERERARALVDKKLRSMHGLDATVQARRLAGMLARKGYSSSIAWSVIREAIADAPEHQPD